MKEIYAKSLDYLKLKLPNFATLGTFKQKFYTCPFCKAPSLVYRTIEDTEAHCNTCNKSGNIYDFVRFIEEDKSKFTDDQISSYIAGLFNMEIVTGEDIAKALEYYSNQQFDMVPIQRNGKIPIEKDWTNKNHKEMYEWKNWIEDNINIGVKTGKISKVIGLDIDSKNIPSKLSALLIACKGFIQQSGKGYHYFFVYDPDIANGNFDFEGVHIDVKSDGGQIVIFPSIVDGVQRKILSFNDITTMPKELKEFLLENLKKKPNGNEKSNYDFPVLEDIKLGEITEGSRNNFLTHFGGILRKNLNLQDTRLVLELVNNKCLKPPLASRELATIVHSLNRYTSFDHTDLAKRIIDYLKVVRESSARDIKEVTNESKELVEKTLAYLVKEEKIIKMARGYKILEKVEWKEEFFKTGDEVPFEFPYFYDKAVFRDGDMIIIGASTGVGKSHIAMNIIKRLVKQGVKPYYISLESGNRFSLISKSLGLIEGDYFWDVHYNPENIQLEKNAVTIIDWLLPKNYAETDKIFEYFSQQLKKNGGILVIFVQLRDRGEFFASDMLQFFPSFVCKFMYDNPDDRSVGKFVPVKIREAKGPGSHSPISTVYNWQEKELKRVDELEEHK